MCSKHLLACWGEGGHCHTSWDTPVKSPGNQEELAGRQQTEHQGSRSWPRPNLRGQLKFPLPQFREGREWGRGLNKPGTRVDVRNGRGQSPQHLSTAPCRCGDTLPAPRHAPDNAEETHCHLHGACSPLIAPPREEKFSETTMKSDSSGNTHTYFLVCTLFGSVGLCIFTEQEAGSSAFNPESTFGGETGALSAAVSAWP